MSEKNKVDEADSKFIKNFKRFKVELHVLRAPPCASANRDDNNAPKSTEYGGVTRGRISSQALKRALKKILKELFGIEMAKSGYDINGCRSRKVNSLIKESLTELLKEESVDQIEELVSKVHDGLFGKGKKGSKEKEGDKEGVLLYFWTSSETNEISELCKLIVDEYSKDNDKKTQKKTDKAFEKAIEQVKKDYKVTSLLNSIDIAYFGRMVGNTPQMDVEAACSKAHAITTHELSNEVDWFTSLDDLSEDQGAGHIGSEEFVSACYYDGTVVDLGILGDNLSDSTPEQLKQILRNVIKSTIHTWPTGKQHSFFSHVAPDYVMVRVTEGVPLQFGNAFEEPVKAVNKGFVKPSIERIEKHAMKLEKWEPIKPKMVYSSVDENFTLDNLCDKVIEAIEAIENN